MVFTGKATGFSLYEHSLGTSGGKQAGRTPIKCTSGNGAITLWFHAQGLRRAVPECKRD